MKRFRAVICLLFVISCVSLTGYLIKKHLIADHTSPKISVTEDTITVSVKADDAELLKGVTAKDKQDGDITDRVRVASKSNFIEKGRRTITYVAFDKANNGTSAERTLVYEDYVSPRIYLDRPLRFTISEARNLNLLKHMSAEDCILGDLSTHMRITLEESWYDQEPGEYALTAQVGNDAGDICEVPMTAVITDNNSIESRKYYPALSEYIVYTSVDQPLELKDYLTGVIRGNTEYFFGDKGITVTADHIKISSEIDYSVPGVYEVEYSYTSLEGITAVTMLYAVVEE